MLRHEKVEPPEARMFALVDTYFESFCSSWLRVYFRAQTYIYSKHQIYTSVKNNKNRCLSVEALALKRSIESCQSEAVWNKRAHTNRGACYGYDSTNSQQRAKACLCVILKQGFSSIHSWKYQWPQRLNSGCTSFPQRIGGFTNMEGERKKLCTIACSDTSRVCCKHLRSCFELVMWAAKVFFQGAVQADEPWFNKQREQGKQSRVYFPC